MLICCRAGLLSQFFTEHSLEVEDEKEQMAQVNAITVKIEISLLP